MISKLESLRSMFQVYDNWLGILRVYFFGGECMAALFDARGSRLSIKISKDNVEDIISLGKIMSKCGDRYEVTTDEIRCSFFGNLPMTFRPDSTEQIDLLKSFYSLSKHAAKIVEFNDEYYLVTDNDGIKWVVRKKSPSSLTDDIKFGPLIFHTQEPREYNWFLTALNKGGTLVDVGANVGGYSIKACKMGARVIALEPDPDNFRVLKLNLELNRCTNAYALNIAAGSREEVRKLYRSWDKRSVGYTLQQSGSKSEVKCNIDVKPLDVAIPPLLRDEWIQLLKVDVEGLEVKVLEGSLDLLRRTRYVTVEVIPATKVKIHEVLNLLRPLGFQLVEKICRPAGGGFYYCDLFLHKFT